MKIRLASILMAVVLVMASGCHSSRHTVRGDSSRKTSSSPSRGKVNYDDMRKHVGSLRFSDGMVSAIVREARGWIGTPYRYAGISRDGVDCSGFVLEVFKASTGAKLPRSSSAQQSWCMPLEKDSLMAGDLVFFATGSDAGKVSHVGIYIGGGEMIHASSSSGVIVSQLRLPYYTRRFHSAGRPPVLGGGDRLEAPARPVPDVPPVIEPMSPAVEEMIDAAVDSVFTDFFN